MKAKRGPSFKPWKAAWLASLDVGDRFQTRRPVRGIEHDRHPARELHWHYAGLVMDTKQEVKNHVAKDAQYKPSQVYYMREGLKRYEGGIGNYFKVAYEADGDDPHIVWLPGNNPSIPMQWEWQRDKLPAIFMPRRAARTFARCVDVRVDRFGEISAEHALQEGIKAHPQWEEGTVQNVFYDAWKCEKFFNEVIIPEIYGDDPPEWWFAYTFEKVEGGDES